MTETNTPQDQGYAKPIRIFHSVFALCMITQLAVGELMDVPEVEGEHDKTSISLITPAYAHEAHHSATTTGPVEESLGFEVHEYLGLFIAALLIIRMILAMTSLPGANWRSLVPWILADGRQQLKKEIHAQINGWKQAKLAAPEDGEAVARSVHGLIILASIIIAITGVLLYFAWSITTPQTESVEWIAQIHELSVTALEALLGAHILAVIVHQYQGHNIMARIKPST